MGDLKPLYPNIANFLGSYDKAVIRKLDDTEMSTDLE
jgi:hypothetical protein